MPQQSINKLRIAILLVLVGYFGFLFLRPSPSAEPPASSGPVVSPASDTPCNAQIEQVGLGHNEVRLRVRGAAERILVYTQQGPVVASTEQSGSAGEYRVRTPGPATAVQLDDCPVLNLR